MSHEAPEPGEIWQDSKGVLLAIQPGGMVMAFGVAAPIPAVTLGPLDRPPRRVFDVRGAYVGEGGLTYPNGFAFRPAPPPPLLMTVGDLRRTGGEG